MNRILASLFVVLLVAACSGAASTGTPSPPPGEPGASSAPTLAPATITSVEAAAARVQEFNPSLAGIGPKDPNLIGGCCWWEGAEKGDGYTVTFEVGWGDCQSGCIERHSWTYAVDRDGAVTLVDESGSPVPADLPGGGSGGGGSGGAGGILPGGSGLQGHVLAGPTCPVVRVNDPACDDRPIAGVTVVILTTAGDEAARTTTDADGFYAVTLPPGPYVIEPQSVDGMIRGSSLIPVVVGDGMVTVDVPYDTGIR